MGRAVSAQNSEARSEVIIQRNFYNFLGGVKTSSRFRRNPVQALLKAGNLPQCLNVKGQKSWLAGNNHSNRISL